MNVKELFDQAENGTLTFEQFDAAAKAAKARFVDLSEGNYVSQNKYNDDLTAKAREIETLQSTISTRDTDLAGLQKQLEEAGADAGKLQELTESLTNLQGKYDNDMKAYKDQLKHQAYEFACDRYADSKTFTSKAAKRDFTRALKEANLKMSGEDILGAEDFATKYSQDNADAFVVDNTPENSGTTDTAENVPHFVSSTQGPAESSDPTGGFHFNFTGVRPVPTQTM